MTEFHHYDAQGRPCDRWGNVITDGIAADGQSIRVPLQLCDSMQREVSQMNDAKKITLTMTASEVRKAIAKHLPGYRPVKSGEENDPGYVQGKQAEGAASRDAYLDGLQDAERDALREQEQVLANGWK